MITDEMVNRAMRIAQSATPVGAGDGDTYVVSPPTMTTMRAALEAVIPMIREQCEKEEREAAKSVAAAYGAHEVAAAIEMWVRRGQTPRSAP